MAVPRLVYTASWLVVGLISFYEIVPGIPAVYKDSNVLVHYRLDGSDANLSYNGTTLTAGRYAGRKAVWFNQSGSSISAPAVVLNGKNLTIACWIKRASDDRGVQTIYADRAHSSHTMHFSFLIKHGTLRFKRAAIEGNPVAQIASEAQVPVGEWAHVAVTWLHEDRLGSLHLDTVEVASQQFGPEYSPFSAPRKSHYLIGNDHWDGNEFVGAIADLYVLNVVLSPDDLNLLRGFPKITTPGLAVSLRGNQLLPCRAEGQPAPHVTWLCEGVVLGEGPSVALLGIPAKRHENWRKVCFACVASNTLGMTSKVVNIKLEEPTPFPFLFGSTSHDAGSALKGHVIHSLRHVTSVLDCMWFCSGQEGCESFNFSLEDQLCELSNATKGNHRSDYTKDQRFTYYEKAGRVMDVADTRNNG